MFARFARSLVILGSLALAGQLCGQNPTAAPANAQADNAQAPKASSTATKSGSPLGSAFRSIFNPGSNVKRMGALQRTNYFDELLSARGRLEVAFVIDGTESMGAELTGMREQLGSLIRDLRRVVGNSLAVQMIVYRDEGAASGPISWPLNVGNRNWATTDVEIASGLAKLVPESGAPYFYEQVDVGLYAALDELNWSKDETATRWIFLIGDAPPFKDGFADEANRAVRHYNSELLKRLAHDKDIQIYGIICPSRSEDLALHQQVLPECRAFFQELADATGGSVLDLANTEQRSQVEQAARVATSRGVKYPVITQAELDQYKANLKKPDDPITVAVLPFHRIESMVWNNGEQMNQLAEEVRSQLDDKGIRTRRLAKIRDEFNQLTRSRVSMDQTTLIQTLAQRLKVDYLIWLNPNSTRNDSAIQVAVINADTGKAEAITDLIDIKKPSNAAGSGNVQLCSQVLQSLATQTKTKSPKIAKVFDGKFQTRLVSTNEGGTQHLETARLCLQRSLRKNASAGDAEELDDAIRALSDAKSMQDNPLWNNLMANAKYTIGLQGELQNDITKAESFDQARSHSRKAIQGSKNPEFIADDHFFNDKFEQARDVYEDIAKSSISPDAACRAHWMLIFLYAGDWGVNKVKKELVDLKKSREHAIALLATYPDSLEAQALKDILHWDESQQRTLVNELALEEDPSPSDLRR